MEGMLLIPAMEAAGGKKKDTMEGVLWKKGHLRRNWKEVCMCMYICICMYVQAFCRLCIEREKEICIERESKYVCIHTCLVARSFTHSNH